MSVSGSIVRIASRLFYLIPVQYNRAISHFVAGLGWHVARSRRRVALTNLRLCFPQKSETERIAIAREHIRAYVQAALEHGFLWNASADAIRKYVVTHDEHHWLQFREGEAKRAVILLCPHFIGLNAAATRFSISSAACSIYSTQSNPELDRMMYEGRMRFNPSKIFARTEGVKPVIRAIRDGYPFYYLPDMDFGARESVFVPFFGVPAATLTAVSRLAKITDAVVVPLIVTQRGDGSGYDVHFHPPLENFPSGDDVEDATRINQLIESHVLKNVPQYLWTHKRFKTRPPGEAGFY